MINLNIKEVFLLPLIFALSSCADMHVFSQQISDIAVKEEGFVECMKDVESTYCSHFSDNRLKYDCILNKRHGFLVIEFKDRLLGGISLRPKNNRVFLRCQFDGEEVNGDPEEGINNLDFCMQELKIVAKKILQHCAAY